MRHVYFFVLGFFALSVSAFAADFTSQYADAWASFEKRGDGAQESKQCADQAAQAFKLAADDAQKYEALILQSRCLYYFGVKSTSDKEKVQIFGQAKNVANQAKALQPERAEAYYFFGINLGRWAEANGIMKSLGERHNLRKNMETALSKTALEFGREVPGKEYDGYGPNRTLGRMYFKLPRMFDGDSSKAEKLLREAYLNMPKDYPNSLNVLYLAEVLAANDKMAEARQILDELIRYEGSPEKYNPRRVPETTDDIAEAKALRKELGR